MCVFENVSCFFSEPAYRNALVHGIDVFNEVKMIGCDWSADYSCIFNKLLNFAMSKESSEGGSGEPVFVSLQDFWAVGGSLRFFEKFVPGSSAKINILVLEELVAALCSSLKHSGFCKGKEKGEDYLLVVLN